MMRPMRMLFTLLLAVLAMAPVAAQDYQPRLGIQSWTLRHMEFDQVVEFCVQHRIKHLQLIDKHLGPGTPPEEAARRKALLDEKGLVFYTFGVAGTSMNPAENRKLFDFAKKMGIRLIIVEPNDFRILDQLESLAREYDIRVAIHNHGIRSLYGNPLVVKTLLQHRDPRMGVCLDVGHVTGAGFDAARVFAEYGDRVFDIHLKDKVVQKTERDDVILDVKVGEGKANYEGLFQALKSKKWDGVLAIETDNGNYQRNPAEFVQSAIQFVTGWKWK
jgi:L-ribulose-5-phosphate 3-epimerase